MKIAICGIRGIPACYGGFETFAEELSERLVKRGHTIRVYGRSHVISHREKYYKGVEIKLLSAPRHKYLETPVHTLNCIWHLIRNPVDAVLVCNAANSPFLWLLRLRGIPVAVNVDGIERKRAKWNFVGRLWYRLGECCSVLFANRVIADAEVIRNYYLETYKQKSDVIAYGFKESSPAAIVDKTTKTFPETTEDIRERLAGMELLPGRYLLFVSRLEPENNAHLVIEAYENLEPALKQMPLVIVGDAPYADEYKARLRRIAGPFVHFLGFRFGADYELLQQQCYLYIQATEVGGTHPALVEAMGFANCVIANETPENQEVLGDAGLYYKKNDVSGLSAQLAAMISDHSRCVANRSAARKRAECLYDWEKITSTYEQLFASLSR